MITSSLADYDTIIIDCTSELQQFRGVVSDLYMPVLELPVLLGYILPSLMSRSNFDARITYLAHRCGEAEGVYTGLLETDEDVAVYDGVYERFAKALIQFGYAVKNKLESYNAYRAGIFAYDLKEYVNDATVVFAKRNLSRA